MTLRKYTKGYCKHCEKEVRVVKSILSDKTFDKYGVVGYALCTICQFVVHTYYTPDTFTVKKTPYRYYMCASCNNIFKFPERDVKKKDTCPFCRKTGKKYRVTRGRI